MSSLTALSPHQSANYGTLGKRQKVVANCAEILKYPEGEVYQYDVVVTPERGDFKNLPPLTYMRLVFDAGMREHRQVKLQDIPMTFEWEDPENSGHPETIAVAQYFQRCYNIGLNYPFLIGITDRRKSVFPIGFCDIVENQHYKGNLDERQTADMVRFACQKLNKNMERIMDIMQKRNLGRSPIVQSFGLSLPNKLAKVESRVLLPHTIMYYSPQLLLIVLQSTNVQVYQTVKSYACTVLGIHTQCMQSKHIKWPNMQYCVNLCLKISAKLGGFNQAIKMDDFKEMLRGKVTLFMGCDVAHLAPGKREKPSITSVVGSTTLEGTRYAATLIQLPSRAEL
ncbi:hypothetical protein GGI20_005033, partial [Coemansia sp. BCRC 34301]